MKRKAKIGGIVIAAIIAISLFAVFPMAISSGEASSNPDADIYVNTTGWWRPGAAFNESSNPIQDAELNASDGDIIFVYNGTYLLHSTPESGLSVNTPNLTLRGEGADVVTLDGNGVIAIFIGAKGYGFEGPAPGCVVEGFTIKNCSTGVAVAENSPNCIIRYNVFEDISKRATGISAANTTFMGNVFDMGGCSDAVYFDRAPITFVDNVVTNATGNWTAVYIRELANNSIIINNTIINNKCTHATASRALTLYKVSNCTVTDNTITGNNGDGIRIWKAANNVIKRNNISSNTRCGICLRDAGIDNKIYLNDIIGNPTSVIYLGTPPTTTYWNSTEPIEYVWNGTTYTNYLGNYWSDYTGTDKDGDGIGDTPYPIPGSATDKDYRPLMAGFENYPAPVWYYKPGYPNYAPSGMPDFDQKQDNWTNPTTGQWSFCGPTAVANCFWWFDSKYADPKGTPGDGMDEFPLVSNYNAPNPVWGSDDHDPSNVDDATTPPGPNGELVERLAWCMDTDGIRTGIPHNGTRVTDMQTCIDNWLNTTGLNNTLYEHTVMAPSFEYIEEEVERSEDVILLLGFWNCSRGTWCRVGGHYVTVAGVNSWKSMIAFSDPFLDIANPSASPTEHNNAANVSHDIYNLSVVNIPQIGDVIQITDYPVTDPDVYQNFMGQNVPEDLEQYQCPSEVPTVAVVEYAVIISPKCVPAIEVNKTVWNGSAWVKETTANLGDTVRFKLWIHNNGTCCNLTNITVLDTLSESLNYSDNATVNGVPQEPVQVGPNEYKWYFPGPLAPCEDITIEFNATVVKCPDVDTNTVNVTAWCNDTMVSDEAHAIVSVLSTPFLIHGWVNYSNGEPVNNPNVRITNLNTSEEFIAETSATSNYYQVSTTSCNVSAGNMLHFNASDNIGNFTEFNHTVTQEEMNNGGFVQNITITLPAIPMPDLIVTAINAYHNNTGCPAWFNLSNEVNVTVKNIGTASAGAFNISLYIEGDYGDTTMHYFGKLPVPGLGAGNSTTVTFTGWVPIGDDCLQPPCDFNWSYKDYNFTAIADCDNDVAESNETNNETTIVDRACYNGYMADEPLENVAHGTLQGHLIYTTGDGVYSSLYNVGDTQTTHYNITLPAGATVELAHLNVYYTWNKPEGTCPEMEVNITTPGGTTYTLPLMKAYNDTKCTCPGALWVYPWGNYVYNVTDYITGSGTYTVTVKNVCTACQYFCVAAPGIVLVYEDANAPLIEYWINEGADVLIGGRRSDGGYLAWWECMNNATFPASTETKEVVNATLGVVSPWAGSSWQPGMTNYLFFNGVKLGTGVYHGFDETYDETIDSISMHIGSTNAQVGVNVTNVTALYLNDSENVVTQADDGDNMMPANAFLVVEYRKCGDVDCSGSVDMADYFLLVDYIAEVPGRTLKSDWAGDVDCSGRIDMADYFLLVDYIAEVPGRNLKCC